MEPSFDCLPLAAKNPGRSFGVNTEAVCPGWLVNKAVQPRREKSLLPVDDRRSRRAQALPDDAESRAVGQHQDQTGAEDISSAAPKISPGSAPAAFKSCLLLRTESHPDSQSRTNDRAGITAGTSTVASWNTHPGFDLALKARRQGLAIGTGQSFN
jgi:hypothetical protein